MSLLKHVEPTKLSQQKPQSLGVEFILSCHNKIMICHNKEIILCREGKYHGPYFYKLQDFVLPFREGQAVLKGGFFFPLQRWSKTTPEAKDCEIEALTGASFCTFKRPVSTLIFELSLSSNIFPSVTMLKFQKWLDIWWFWGCHGSLFRRKSGWVHPARVRTSVLWHTSLGKREEGECCWKYTGILLQIYRVVWDTDESWCWRTGASGKRLWHDAFVCGWVKFDSNSFSGVVMVWRWLYGGELRFRLWRVGRFGTTG